jgi:hypothetical protein
MGTMTVTVFAWRGFEKDIFAARQICIAHPEARDPRTIEEHYRESFGFMGSEWTQRNIIERRDATDHRQMAYEVDDALRSHPTIGQALRPYPLPEHDTRPYEVKQGNIVDRYYEELKKMRQASKPRPLSEGALRQQFGDFEVWSVMPKVPEHVRRELFIPSIGDAKVELLFRCIGHMMTTSASTVNRWYKKFRAYSGAARHRRKSK